MVLAMVLRSVADLRVVLLVGTAARAVGWWGKGSWKNLLGKHAPGGSAHAVGHHHSTRQQPSAWQRNVCGLL